MASPAGRRLPDKHPILKILPPSANEDRQSTWGGTTDLIKDESHSAFRSSAWKPLSPLSKAERGRPGSANKKAVFNRFASSLRGGDTAADEPRSRSASARRAGTPTRQRGRAEWQVSAFHGDIARVHVSQRHRRLSESKDASAFGAV